MLHDTPLLLVGRYSTSHDRTIIRPCPSLAHPRLDLVTTTLLEVSGDRSRTIRRPVQEYVVWIHREQVVALFQRQLRRLGVEKVDAAEEGGQNQRKLGALCDSHGDKARIKDGKVDVGAVANVGDGHGHDFDDDKVENPIGGCRKRGDGCTDWERCVFGRKQPG